MLKEFSSKNQISTYDIYSGLRDVALIFLSFLVTNIDLVQGFLTDLNIKPFYASFIVYFLVELGRKFKKDYSGDAVVKDDEVDALVKEIINLP